MNPHMTPPRDSYRRREYHRDCSIPANAPVNQLNAQRLANLRLDTPGRSLGDNGEEPNGQRSRIKDRNQSNASREVARSKWLRSMRHWRQGLGEGWVGIRVLGQGGNGIAGLWSYRPDPVTKARHEQARRTALKLSSDAPLPKQIENVVVKQQRARNNGGLYEEGRIMEVLNQAETEHIPKIYGCVQRDIGSGVPNMRIDDDRREVHRIFLEFVAGGDMDTMIEKCQVQLQQNGHGFVREEACWSAMDCLVRAFFAMETKKELPDISMERPWEGSGMVHFDLKPLNVFVGSRDSDLHATHPVHKVGDFGLALFVGDPKDQDEIYRHRVSKRGTVPTLAPEQHRRSYTWLTDTNNHALYDGDVAVKRYNFDLESSQRKYGTWTNVYQIGCCMYMLMCLTTHFPGRGHTYISTMSPELLQGQTIGEDIERGVFLPREDPQAWHGPGLGQLPYSRALKSIVLQCLMQSPDHRPGLADLRYIIDGALSTMDTQSIANEYPSNSLWANTNALPASNNAPPQIQTALQNVPSSQVAKDYWALDRNREQFAPLEWLVLKVKEDRLRRAQVVEARRMVGQLNVRDAQQPITVPITPMTGKRRQNDEQKDDEDVAEAMRGAKRKRLANSVPRQTQFYLTLQVFDHHHRLPPAPENIDYGLCNYDACIDLLREHLSDHPYGMLTQFRISEARIARPGAVPHSRGWNLPIDMNMRDAARPKAPREGDREQAVLEIHRDANDGNASSGVFRQLEAAGLRAAARAAGDEGAVM